MTMFIHMNIVISNLAVQVRIWMVNVVRWKAAERAFIMPSIQHVLITFHSLQNNLAKLIAIMAQLAERMCCVACVSSL